MFKYEEISKETWIKYKKEMGNIIKESNDDNKSQGSIEERLDRAIIANIPDGSLMDKI